MLPTITATPMSFGRRAARLPAPNRHVTGQGHYRTPQKATHPHGKSE
ncbi:hypothetical protein [Vibrio cidicii]|nr:hypothetical protein [Vibrio cidicii]